MSRTVTCHAPAWVCNLVANRVGCEPGSRVRDQTRPDPQQVRVYNGNWPLITEQGDQFTYWPSSSYKASKSVSWCSLSLLTELSLCRSNRLVHRCCVYVDRCSDHTGVLCVCWQVCWLWGSAAESGVSGHICQLTQGQRDEDCNADGTRGLTDRCHDNSERSVLWEEDRGSHGSTVILRSSVHRWREWTLTYQQKRCFTICSFLSCS